MLGNVRIRTRLLCGFATVLSATSAISAIAIFSLDSPAVRTVLLIALGVVLLIASCFAWFLTRSIVKPLNEAVAVTEAISGGNLNVDVMVQSNDEIGQLLDGMQQMVVKLRGVIASVKIVADSVATGSRELARASENLGTGAAKLSEQIQSIVTAMGEISRAVADVAENAASSASASEHVLQTALGGRAAVDTTAKDMEIIAGAIQSAAATIGELRENSTQIGQIVGVINEIAGQTNLLALNAAIEAARAGEQGRGFAVVADEVRSLAERTAQSTKNVADKVHGIQQAAAGSVLAIQQGSQEASKGVDLSREARRSLDAIVETSGKAEDIAQRIAAATEEQSAAVGEVASNLEKISEITGQSVDATEKIRGAAGDLAKLAVDLKEMISFFKGTTAEAEALVKKAIAHIRKNGRTKAFAEFSDKNGEFVNRDLFVFVYDMQGNCLAHGRYPEKIGENMLDSQGPDGSFHVRERINIAKTSGKGWQQFKSINPVTRRLENKVAYVEVCDDLIVSSGAYK